MPQPANPASTKRTTTRTSLPPVVWLMASSSAYFARRGQREQGCGEQREDGEEGAQLVRPRQPQEHAEPPPRDAPRPVDLRAAHPSQSSARLVDSHATSSTSARASTASANCRSSRPWSWI